MTRTFQDDDLLLWEAYTAAPRAGQGHGARLMFHCLTETDLRARVLELDEDRSDLEKQVHEATDGELVNLLSRSASLD